MTFILHSDSSVKDFLLWWVDTRNLAKNKHTQKNRWVLIKVTLKFDVKNHYEIIFIESPDFIKLW